MRKILSMCALSLLSMTIAPSLVKGDTPDKKEFVRGGQFKDLILPIPIINGLENEGIWGEENVVPRDADNGIEDNEWCYWGGNPIKCKDGRFHIAICRWRESTGHNGWFHSEVAHCVSDNVLGPYKVTKTIVKKGHNPEVQPLPDGTYALHTASEELYLSDAMDGEWRRAGRLSLQARGFRPTNRLGSNLTTAFRDDGSIIIMTKGGDIAISRGDMIGPYKMVSTENYTRHSGYAEDPVIWHSRYQYHCIYNHAQDQKSGYMRSLDGIHWKNEEGLPYDVSSTYYEDGSKNEWYKFERPKIVQDELGRATHLSLAVIDVPKGQDKGNDNHSSKHMVLPLVKERLVSIVGKKSISAKTKKIIVKIEAEAGFDPQTELNIASLRFGSDSKVNYGAGCEVYQTKHDGKNMLLYFKGDNGLNRFDYDFKLIGETYKGELIIGYALLPGESSSAASLIAMPVKAERGENNLVTLEAEVENSGLTRSDATEAELYENSAEGWKRIDRFMVKELAPYDKVMFSSRVNCPEGENREYELRIKGQKTYLGYWCRVDENHSSVEFVGDWGENKGGKYYMGSEKTTDKVGNAVKFKFNGTKAAAYGSLDNKMGLFEVYIDGEYIESIRLSWGGADSKIYQTPMLEDGPHTLELRAAKYTNNSSLVSIDGFAFESEENRK